MIMMGKSIRCIWVNQCSFAVSIHVVTHHVTHAVIHLVIIVNVFCSSEKHVRAMYTFLNPLLQRKTGVCWGIPNFLIFDPKHALWILVRTTSVSAKLISTVVFPTVHG